MFGESGFELKSLTRRVTSSGLTLSVVPSRNVRGIYCLLVCATLLDMLTPELVAGTSNFLKK